MLNAGKRVQLSELWSPDPFRYQIEPKKGNSGASPRETKSSIGFGHPLPTRLGRARSNSVVPPMPVINVPRDKMNLSF